MRRSNYVFNFECSKKSNDLELQFLMSDGLRGMRACARGSIFRPPFFFEASILGKKKKRVIEKNLVNWQVGNCIKEEIRYSSIFTEILANLEKYVFFRIDKVLQPFSLFQQTYLTTFVPEPISYD